MSKTLAPTLIAICLFSIPAITLAARAHAICKDHTISYSVHRQGACSWHKGVLKWLY